MDEPVSGSLSSEGSVKKTSSNPLSKLLFRRKNSSSRKGEDGGEPTSPQVVDGELDEEEKDPSFVEEVKEVIESLETSTHNLFHHHKKDDSHAQPIDASTTVSRSESSSESKESRYHLLSKVKHGIGKAKEGLKEEYGKAKDELKAMINKEKMVDDHQEPHEAKINNEKIEDHQPSNKIDPKPDIEPEEKLPSVDEVKAPNLAQRIQEEVVAVISTIEDAKKGHTSQEENKEIKGEKKEEIKEIKVEKKEEQSCVSTLAQGLQNMCSWGSKKED